MKARSTTTTTCEICENRCKCMKTCENTCICVKTWKPGRRTTTTTCDMCENRCIVHENMRKRVHVCENMKARSAEYNNNNCNGHPVFLSLLRINSWLFTGLPSAHQYCLQPVLREGDATKKISEASSWLTGAVLLQHYHICYCHWDIWLPMGISERT